MRIQRAVLCDQREHPSHSTRLYCALCVQGVVKRRREITLVSRSIIRSSSPHWNFVRTFEHREACRSRGLTRSLTPSQSDDCERPGAAARFLSSSDGKVIQTARTIRDRKCQTDEPGQAMPESQFGIGYPRFLSILPLWLSVIRVEFQSVRAHG